LSCSKN